MHSFAPSVLQTAYCIRFAKQVTLSQQTPLTLVRMAFEFCTAHHTYPPVGPQYVALSTQHHTFCIPFRNIALEMSVFCIVASRSLLEDYERFSRAWCLHRQDTHLPDYEQQIAD
jgi:hypothetical protein